MSKKPCMSVDVMGLGERAALCVLRMIETSYSAKEDYIGAARLAVRSSCGAPARRQLQCCLAAATVNSGLGTGPARNAGGNRGNPGLLTVHTGQRSAWWLPRTA